VTAGQQPLLGWRLWRLHGGRLRSWVVDEDWEAGPNEARCLASTHPASVFDQSRGRCAHPPGMNCKCGLWALWDYGRCARKAREESQRWDSRDVVIGLMAGWGTVAIHGDEGFRSQYAMVRCLFTDAISDRLPDAAERRPGWWERLIRLMRVGEPGGKRAAALRQAAELYGVPLLSLEDAIRLGVLSEFGVPPSRIREAAAQLP